MSCSLTPGLPEIGCVARSVAGTESGSGAVGPQPSSSVVGFLPASTCVLEVARGKASLESHRGEHRHRQLEAYSVNSERKWLMWPGIPVRTIAGAQAAASLPGAFPLSSLGNTGQGLREFKMEEPGSRTHPPQVREHSSLECLSAKGANCGSLSRGTTLPSGSGVLAAEDPPEGLPRDAAQWRSVLKQLCACARLAAWGSISSGGGLSVSCRLFSRLFCCGCEWGD